MSRNRTIRSVKRSCDSIWSELVRAGGHCERCGATSEQSQLHAHHAYGRNNHRLRWERRNGVCLCARCHRRVHDEPLEFALWFSERRFEDALWLAKYNKKGLLKRNLQDYLNLEATLQHALRAAESRSKAD